MSETRIAVLLTREQIQSLLDGGKWTIDFEEEWPEYAEARFLLSAALVDLKLGEAA